MSTYLANAEHGKLEDAFDRISCQDEIIADLVIHASYHPRVIALFERSRRRVITG
jgi:hypothetical protein